MIEKNYTVYIHLKYYKVIKKPNDYPERME